MNNITPIPTPEQRIVLRELEALAVAHDLTPRQRQKVKARYLAAVAEGRSTAVAVAESRAVMHGRHKHTNCGPSAA